MMRNNRVSLKQNSHWAVEKKKLAETFLGKKSYVMFTEMFLCVSSCKSQWQQRSKDTLLVNCKQINTDIVKVFVIHYKIGLFFLTMALHSNTKIKTKIHPSDFPPRYNQTQALVTLNLLKRDKEKSVKDNSFFSIATLPP